jgi:hypothetical protein
LSSTKRGPLRPTSKQLTVIQTAAALELTVNIFRSYTRPLQNFTSLHFYRQQLSSGRQANIAITSSAARAAFG